MTLLELVAALAIVGLIIVPIAVIINQFIFIPGQLSASVTLMNGSRQAVRWIAEDTRQSDSFVSSTSPEYGTLSWTDRTQSPIAAHTVRYFFSSTGESLMREETMNGDSQTITVADNIQAYGDISILETGGLVLASVTSTASTITETTTRNASIRAQRRPVLQTAHPTPPPIRLAWDDFESGDFTGGSGWLGDWAVVGIADVTGLGVPAQGAFHLRLRQATTTATTTVDRSLDLSGQSKVRVQFQAKADAFAPGDVAQLRVSPDGVDFTVVRTWPDGQDDNVYHSEDIDLSSFSMSAEFFIAFDAVLSLGGEILRRRPGGSQELVNMPSTKGVV